ncbi:MAG TPA: hypothetical protein VFQ85_08055 [Mycobacteriales bacterium]|jgi:hypothetical protein|nr:hypothetical protein [Mycobacteriales bacterium]
MSAGRAVAGAALAACLATACVGPSRTDDDYRAKAANTAEAVRSSVGTARLAVRAADEKRAFGPYLTRLLAEAEEDALAAQQAFDSVQPPSERADHVHDDLDDLVTEALDALRELRVTVRRGEYAHLAENAAALAKVSDELAAFEEHPS